jgi:hypothetical protein
VVNYYDGLGADSDECCTWKPPGKRICLLRSAVTLDQSVKLDWNESPDNWASVGHLAVVGSTHGFCITLFKTDRIHSQQWVTGIRLLSCEVGNGKSFNSIRAMAKSMMAFEKLDDAGRYYIA